MKKILVQCSKCPEFIERSNLKFKPVCFECKRKRKLAAQKKHASKSPMRKFHQEHIGVDALIVYFGQKVYMRKRAIETLIKRYKNKWEK